MIKQVKYQLLTGWHLFRLIRLVIGVVLLVQAIGAGDVLIGGFAFILLFQSITNTGCCGPACCAVPLAKQYQKETPEPGSEQ